MHLSVHAYSRSACCDTALHRQLGDANQDAIHDTFACFPAGGRVEVHQDSLRTIHTLAGGLTAVPSLAIVLACSLPNARRFSDILNALFKATCT